MAPLAAVLGPLLKGVPALPGKGEGHALEEAFPADHFNALYEKQAGWFMINVCQGETIWFSGTSL